MTYFLGIDLGTTYTAAASWRDGRVSIACLGTRAATIPSVVVVREDGQVVTGEAAERRALIEPQRVAREFKRRVGDPTPLFLGGTPFSTETLMAKLLRAVVDEAASGEDAPPAGIAVSHPANWGEYKKDLLLQAIRLADLDPVSLITEPEAAAIHYASQERVKPGSMIAVYDLGGGTFDAAVMRRTGVGWEILGQPEGVERLGGIDFDAAVLRHVRNSVGGADDELDANDPPMLAAAARLRQECVAAKEALTADADTTIPVLLPGLQADVRLTRGEFEEMIRPALADSITALQRALRSASVEASDISAILLAGGSSRIPLVGELVGAALGRPLAVDAHPKHGVAMGAAIVAAQEGLERISTGSLALRPDDRAVGAGRAAGVSLAVPAHLPHPLAALTPSVGIVATPRRPPRVRRGQSTFHVRSLSGRFDPDEPPRPPLALLVSGAAVLVAVVLIGLLVVGGNREVADQPSRLPDESPDTVPGNPVTAAISGPDETVPVPPPVPEVATTLPPGATTTLAPTSTTTVSTTTSSVPSTTAPETTTSLPGTTTTVATTAPPPPEQIGDITARRM